MRPATAADKELLFALLRDALGPHIEAVHGPWDEAEQRARFDANTDPATHDVIEEDGEPIGCLFVRRGPDEIRVNRVFLFPHAQSRGVGALLVRDILADAARTQLPVRLRVLHGNPARRFWERLGFRATGATETHMHFEWSEGGEPG